MLGCLQTEVFLSLPLAEVRCEVETRNLDKAGTVAWVTLAEVKSQPCGDTWHKTYQEWADCQLLECSIFLFFEPPG